MAKNMTAPEGQNTGVPKSATKASPRRRKQAVKKKWYQSTAVRILAILVLMELSAICVLISRPVKKRVVIQVVHQPIPKPSLNRWDSQLIYNAMKLHLQEVKDKYAGKPQSNP